MFSTGTTIGVEVGFKPESDAPFDLVVGYKRAEVLFDPIMDDTPTNADPNNRKTYKILPQAHSVVAKLLGEINVSSRSGAGPEGDAGLTIGQWFASGKAAEILVENGGAAALTDNPNVARAVSESAARWKSRGDIPAIVFSLTNQIYGEISRIVQKDDPNFSPEIRYQAERVYHLLNGSPLTAKVPPVFERYVPAPSADANALYFAVQRDNLTDATGFQRVIDYRSKLDASVDQLSKLRKAIIKKQDIHDKADPSGNPISETRKEELLNAYEEQKDLLSTWEQAMAEDPAVVDMWRFLGGE